MTKKIQELEIPLNANERFLYACAVRLDALCEMVSSIVEHIAERDGVAVEQAVEEKPKRAPRRKAAVKEGE